MAVIVAVVPIVVDSTLTTWDKMAEQAVDPLHAWSISPVSSPTQAAATGDTVRLQGEHD